MLGDVFGISFLTPGDSLFALAALVPLAVVALVERRSARVRAVLGVGGPGLRRLVPVVAALALVPALVAVAAAQPVVVRQQLVGQRADAQGFFVIDTSRSMLASAGPHRPTRIARARRLARLVRAAIPDVATGIASMTDRTLPDVMPTTDASLFDRTLVQSVGIDEPPPSQNYYTRRATNLLALVPLVTSGFYSSHVRRRLLVVFTDGESAEDSKLLGIEFQHQLQPIFVHVWADGERIYEPGGRFDPQYVSDSTSWGALKRAAAITGGFAFGEHQLAQIEAAERKIVGRGPLKAQVSAYARVALAPWFALGGVVPLGFLLYRRNL